METIEIKIDDTQVKYVMKYYGLNSKDFYHKRYTALSDFAQQAVDEKIKNLETPDDFFLTQDTIQK